jgi:hypothetical protein
MYNLCHALLYSLAVKHLLIKSSHESLIRKIRMMINLILEAKATLICLENMSTLICLENVIALICLENASLDLDWIDF